MSALPPDGVIQAAVRWWQLLGRSSLSQAWAIIRADAAYADLTPTQYAAALDWLQLIGGVVRDGSNLAPNPRIRGLPHSQVMRLLFQRSLERAQPAWLPDADVLVADATELPQDAQALADSLDVAAGDAFLAVLQAQRKVDLERRATIGAAGERLLVELLERHRPGSTSHVSLEDDGLGYDIVLTQGAQSWHLEVKTTTRRGRLVLYLSRHEYEVSLVDSAWRLVVAGLGDDENLSALATVRTGVVAARTPWDQHRDARWEAVRVELFPEDLEWGLPFLEQEASPVELRLSNWLDEAGRFGWLPQRGRNRLPGAAN